MSDACLLSATEDLAGMGAAVEAPDDLCAVGAFTGGDKERVVCSSLSTCKSRVSVMMSSSSSDSCK